LGERLASFCSRARRLPLPLEGVLDDLDGDQQELLLLWSLEVMVEGVGIAVLTPMFVNV
jgi:hypothetical protein